MVWPRSGLLHWYIRSRHRPDRPRESWPAWVGRCRMVITIGFVTMGALLWVIATSMAGESDAEKRRMSAL